MINHSILFEDNIFEATLTIFCFSLSLQDGSDVIAIFQASREPSVVLHQKSNTQLSGSFSLIDRWEIPVDVIECHHPLGEGCFGEVYLGHLREDFSSPAFTSYLRQQSGRPYVAIKLLKCKY